MIGVVYYRYFYREFGINIIQFSDLSDFLLVAVLEPRSLMIFIAVVIFITVAYRVDLLMRRWFRAKGWYIKRKLPLKYADPIISTIVLIIATNILIERLAMKNVDEVKSGVVDQYRVRIADQSAVQSLALLGSSNRFVYWYDVKKAEVTVVPVENVSYMQKSN